MNELSLLDEMITRAETLVKTLKEARELQAPSARTSSTEREVKQKITDALKCLGVPMHIKGHCFLRDAIGIAVENPAAINAITKYLCPQIAKANNTTQSRVERAIRRAIEVAHVRGDKDFVDDVFGHTMNSDKGKPTNSEFIATITDYVRSETA